MRWRHVDGCAVGTAHRETQTPCQDRSACAAWTSRDGGEVFASVLSDGAGSASRCEAGAEMVCAKLIELTREALAETSDLATVTDELVRSWFVAIREALGALAFEEKAELRDYAATALLALAGERHILCAQVGDGGIVLRRASGEPFEVALWPDGGEYANETFFITDESVEERIRIRRFEYVEDVVAFTDGLQHLALEHASRTAFVPFFEPLIGAVREPAASDGSIRTALLQFLNSETLNRRTDDDKSLAIGCRMAPSG